MLDILVLGDTRCGKGYVAQGLSRHYGLGDIASGDSCSFAGLVGGLQQIRNSWRITWGLLPLNNNRLVIIDEASSMSPDDIARMSRIRSEGVAEIVKIIRESTQANTRLIWLANPRSGRPILSYNTGVQAVKELVGAVEDISRFDIVLTLATNEVPSEVINAVVSGETDDKKK
jgi:DNA replicative helicase MCM subunit Mcm2 (Cdc46/Mcm family)